MKRKIALIVAAVMMISLAACGKKPTQQEEPKQVAKEEENKEEPADTEDTDDEIEGGWTVNQEDRLSDEDKAVLQKALEGYDVSYEPIRLLATQVVSGTNYAFLCLEKKEGSGIEGNGTEEKIYSIVYVYADPEGNTLGLRMQPLISYGEEGETGAWSAIASEEEATAAVAALEKAAFELDGVAYEAVVPIGSQVVAGTNYRVLCKTTPVIPDAKSSYAIVTVYEDLDGNVSFSELEELEFISMEETEEE